jgi:hypothetical protein
MIRACFTSVAVMVLLAHMCAPVQAQIASVGPRATAAPGFEYPIPPLVVDFARLAKARAPQLFVAPQADFAPAATVHRPRALVPMYAGFVALQGYDTYSTLKALRGGAIEVNPLMGGAANQLTVFVAVKSATTFGAIYASERLWRKHRKGAAVAVMAFNNGLTAIVAVHNASVLRAQRSSR